MSNAAIYGDWGTTHLRLWRIEQGVIAASASGPGIGGLKGRDPAEVLREAVARLAGGEAPARIVLCGMVGARNGLHEVHYAKCPVDADAWQMSRVDLVLDGMSLRLAAGVSCRDRARSDVMRGEETQIFGAIHRDPALGCGQHTIVLPGTHSKWATLDDGRITAFRTFLTGELFALLRSSSLLAAGGVSGAGSDDEGFVAGLERAGDAGGALGALFEARAAQLCDGRSATWASGFISGLLLGSELAEMGRNGSLPQQVNVIGGAELAERYGQAFAQGGVKAHLLDGEACTLAGLELLDAHD